tara:strand:+ start:607 stop:795 length:189 start_codon:yes stop_codon:yes gene_type:complete
MNEFEIEFETERRRLNLKKMEIADKLGITLPTLQTKILEPNRLTLKDIGNLKELNFNLNFNI